MTSSLENRSSTQPIRISRSLRRLRHRTHKHTQPLDILQQILNQMLSAASLDHLLEQTIAILHQTLHNSSTAVLQLLPDGNNLYARAILTNPDYTGASVIPIYQGLLGTAARTQQTVVTNDAYSDPRYSSLSGHHTRAELCVPIMTRHSLWGVLNLESESVNAFPKRIIRMVEIVAQQLAVAVENTALINQANEQTVLLERRARELAMVLDLNSQLRASMDLDTLLQHQATAISTIMGFQSVVVNLIDVERNLVWVAATYGCDPEEQTRLRDATYQWDGLLKSTLERFRVSQSYFIPAEADVQIEGISIALDLDERAPYEWQPNDMLLVPIINHGNQILGMFSVDNPIDRQRPSLATIQGLEIFAAHTAAAIENVRLFAQSQTALEALKQASNQQAQLLSKIQRTQADLINASKLAAVGTLAAGVAHEFNNLLAGMNGYAELGQVGTLEEKDEALEVIRRTCRRGVQLTRRLLTFARQSDGTREMAQVDEIAEGALQLISWDLARNHINVVRDYIANDTIWVDAGQIMQVVLNLLSNARDATAPGGTVTISTHADPQWVQLEVSDTGSGIAAEIRSRIFEPFVTTKGALGGSAIAGTGLGLSVSYGIVQDHHGQLLVDSIVGQGSKFTVRLPRQHAVITQERPPIPATPHIPPISILVVDDEDAVRSVVAQLLARAGHIITQANDGFAVLERCTREHWDLIISDMTMPGLDGPAMIRQLRERNVTTPVILMTGRVDGEGLAHTHESDAVTVLIKPFDANELLTAVATTSTHKVS